MSDQREMTIEEWCAKLPADHLVNKQLRELKLAAERYMATVKKQEESFAGLLYGRRGMP